ncbi:MAG: universal stress protein [Desulfatitalea sp. BRH_c12]|nr:MAG: universal stress protein [Desulfatitalea sp. BRH_c12]
MFKKILFATSASPVCDNAAKVAFDLELKWDARLIVFHVLGIPTHGFSPFVTDVRTGEREQVDPDYVDWVKEEMRNTYADLLKDTENVTLEAAVGVPHREILRKARDEDVDMIVMGAHTRPEDIGASRFRNVVGSTMQKVAKGARCPVVIISRPCTTCWKLFSNIVVGIDLSKASGAAFLWAARLAREVDANLHIFHAVDLAGTEVGQIKSQEEIEAHIATVRGKIENLYLPQLKGYEKVTVMVREGVPYVEILKQARERQADLIVMAHHTREIDPEQALLGSTVEQVVLRSACPVASVNRLDKTVDTSA